MKKRIAFLTAVLICLTVLSGCCLEHQWQDATCEAPKTCAECGETEGEALGHDWVSATCQEPAYCSICNETTGDVAPHIWVSGDCETACEACGTRQPGTSTRHVWQAATCSKPSICDWCGKTKGEADGDHEWFPATVDDPMTCTICGTTEGEPLQLDPRFDPEAAEILRGEWDAKLTLPTASFTFWNPLNQWDCTVLFYFNPDYGTVICELRIPGSGPSTAGFTISAEGVYYVEDGYLYIGRDWDQPMEKLEFTLIETDESASYYDHIKYDAFILHGDITALLKTSYNGSMFIKDSAVIDVSGLEFLKILYAGEPGNLVRIH